MLNNILNFVKNLSESPDGDPLFRDNRYFTHPIDDKHFYEIKTNDNIPIAFVDGGNACIYSSQSFSISLIRLYLSSTFHINMPRRIEFYALVYPLPSGLFASELFPITGIVLDKTYLQFDPCDPGIRDGNFAADISKIPGYIRRFAEWDLCKRVISQMNEGLVVKDGSLQTGVTNEYFFVEPVYSLALDRGIYFCGISKTSSIYTTTGKNLMAVLKKRSRLPVWYYYIAESTHPDHKANIYAAKLHANSSHIFRIDMLKGQQIEKVIWPLLINSTDYRFPGYPYGLIEADRNARVTEAETRCLRALFHASLGSDIDPHEMLNRITN